MIATPEIEEIIGAEAVDPNNDRIGRVSQVYVDADTDQPTWASVRTGVAGANTDPGSRSPPYGLHDDRHRRTRCHRRRAPVRH